MHSIALMMKSWFPQKQFASALSLHTDVYSQVFRQRGSKLGQSGVGEAERAVEAEVGPAGLDADEEGTTDCAEEEGVVFCADPHNLLQSVVVLAVDEFSRVEEYGGAPEEDKASPELTGGGTVSCELQKLTLEPRTGEDEDAEWTEPEVQEPP